MNRFAQLIQQLGCRPRREDQLRLLEDYFRRVPDPDRGHALSVLTGSPAIRAVSPASLRRLAGERIDPTLFQYAHEYVGDLAETVALAWPERATNAAALRLPEVMAQSQCADKAALSELLAGWLDRLDTNGRWALLKLLSGGLRPDLSPRLAKAALARYGGLPLPAVEELWHAQSPPYEALFAWAEGRAGPPDARGSVGFRPWMGARSLDETTLGNRDPSSYLAEWKWTGERLQVAAEAGTVRLYDRDGDDVTPCFPDVAARVDFEAVLDGIVVAVRDGTLQRRLGRKTASLALQRDCPVEVRLHDLLFENGEDLRARPFAERRDKLERWFAAQPRPGFTLSPILAFSDWDGLRRLRREAAGGVTGVLLKRRDSAYLAGCPDGSWLKWKRDPDLVDAVLLYAARGDGGRSPMFSDFTVGVWREGDLVPVGKATARCSDDETAALDRWVRANTTNRFGPVREVSRELVLEVAFDGVLEARRRKAGLALRVPRIHRIKWQKTATDAGQLAELVMLLGR